MLTFRRFVYDAKLVVHRLVKSPKRESSLSLNIHALHMFVCCHVLNLIHKQIEHVMCWYEMIENIQSYPDIGANGRGI